MSSADALLDASFKIYLAGPAANFYAGQLTERGWTSVEFGLPAADAPGPMLVITEPRQWWIDWPYFLSFRAVFPEHLLRLGCIQLNHGQPLADIAWPHLDLKAGEVLPPCYRDGVVAVGIYYFPANPALSWEQREGGAAKIIPTPLRWPSETWAAEFSGAAAPLAYAPTPSPAAGRFQQRLLLLDRDGVINVDGHYPAHLEDIKLRPAIFPVLQYAQARGVPCIVLSNQSGIARGKFSRQDLKNVTAYLQEQLALAGIKIAGWYDCPFYLPASASERSALPHDATLAPYQVYSLWRKPLPGMALQAAADFDGDLRHSVMVGDKLSDALYAATHNFWLQTSPEYVTTDVGLRPYGTPQVVADEQALLAALKKIWP
ncbi:MAG: HAD-IIIA family hydrolase [Bacteriovoracaceae bacterium]|nr:HAD-IIIA family hydrolase [Bacteriovoracaceae bacterium]